MSLPISNLWNYVLDGVSDPWWLLFGDPSIVDPDLVLTFDDIVAKQVPIFVPGYFMRFQLTFTGAQGFFVFDGFNFTYLGKWPSVSYDGVVLAGGGRYNEADLIDFGAINAQPLIGLTYKVGIYMKGDPDGNNCSLAFRINDGTNEYASGFVLISGQNIGQALEGNNQLDPQEQLVGPIDGYEELEPSEVDFLYAQSVLTATLNPTSEEANMELIRIDSKGLLRDQIDVTPSDTADNNNAIFPSEGAKVDTFEYANAIYIEEAGNVAVILHTGETSAMNNLVAGLWHNCSPFKQVLLTGTSVSSVKAGVTSWRYNMGS